MATMHEEKASKHHFPHAARGLVDAEIVNTNTKKLGNNPRLARNVIISFVLFNKKKTLNLFNLDIG